MRWRTVRGAGISVVVSLVAIAGFSSARGDQREEADAALRKAVHFFRTEVSVQGAYLWRYSADLARREGEGRASADTAWVQPPGTPSVGQAYLSAYERTQDRYLLDAARETARALVRGQLHSGGWDYRIEFSADRKRYAYRVDGPAGKKRNVTTLDDDTTQAAVQFLMNIDRALEFADAEIHQAARYALDRLVDAQYRNGAWPQRFSGPPNHEDYPVLPASFPDKWSRTHPKAKYNDYYTFNDNTIADTIAVMLSAAEIYNEPKYQEAAEKAGSFILLAQLPDPQPAWAQQYNSKMQPAWARRFEPPAVTGGESQGVLRTLLFLYRETGDARYLEPVPKALAYLKKSQLPDGRLARFYELRTNRPLYFTTKYELTYASDDLPTHYGFIVGSRLESIEREYQKLRKDGPPKKSNSPVRWKLSNSLSAETKRCIAQLDHRGAWVESGRLRAHGDDDPTRSIISTDTFRKNVDLLSRYLAATATP